MISGAITSSLLTSLNIFSPTRHRVDETSDARTIASFLTRDAQAAGGSDPNTGSLDTASNLGVSTTDAAGCANTTTGAALLLRFKWFDRTPTLTAGEQNVVVHVANYYEMPSSDQLVRTTCDSGSTPVPASSATLNSPTSATLATTVANATASCNPAACRSLPDTVSLTITATNQSGVSDVPTAPYTYTLTASMRPEGQTAPCDATDPSCGTPTGTINPLIALGGSCNPDGVSGLDVGGASQVDVNGGVTLSGPTGSCPASHFHQGSNGSFQSGAINEVSQVVDPFAGLTPPGDTCATTTGNPATTLSGGATHYHPGTYKTNPGIGGNSTVVFDPGNYVFCAGLSVSGNGTNVSGTGVLLYIKGGTLNLNSGTTNLTAQSTGDYAGLLVWQAAADTTTPMVLSGNTSLNLDGVIYAPSIEVQLRGGATTFFVKAIIAGSVSFSGTSGITIGTPPPQLFISSPASLPSWTSGVPYPTTNLTATGGSGGNSWTVTNLPNGLVFDPVTNTISGTPTVTSTTLFNPHIKLVDSDGDIALATYSVTINVAPAITGPATLPPADINRSYPPPSKTAVMTEAGGTGPGFLWTAINMPPGLGIDPQDGTISGIPTTPGSYTPTITLKDAAGAIATKSYASSPIVISDLPGITAPSGPTLPSWTTGQSGYSQQITVTGGTGPFTWQLSAAPSGLSISSTGLITGTPTGPQTYSMVVTATDAVGVSDSKTYGLTINPGLSINCSVPNGEINVPYSGSCATTGGTPPYTYSWTPVPGLVLDPNSGTITGAPSVANTYTRTITVTDSVGTTFPKTVSFVINPAPTVTTSALPSWTISQNYGSSNTTMKGNGGLTPYIWSDGGTLPPGLTLNSSTGQITGTPTTTGTYTVTMTLTDFAGVQATHTYLVSINASPSITTGSLPDGEQSVSYSLAMQATGGTPDASGHYQWTISSGLPAGSGLSINATTGVLSGTPTVSGSFTVTIVATDVAGATDSVPLPLLLTPPPSVTSTSLPAATRTQVGYSQSLSSSGGTGAITWTLTGGSLPANLALSSTGVISGNVGAAATTQTFTVTATDAVAGVATKSLTLTVNPAPTITTASLANATNTEVGYSQTLAASGGTGTITWSLGVGTPPAGLSLSTGGVISGTVGAAATTQTFTVSATDANGVAVSKSLTITVLPRPAITSVALNNGGTAGTIDKGDQVVVVFSQQMSVASFCSAWANDAVDQPTSATSGVSVAITDGTGVTNDSLTVTSTSCAFNFGSIDLGSNAYATGGNITFGGSGNNASTIAWTAATHTLTITLGKSGGSGTAGSVASSTPIYSASGSIKDPNGVAPGNSPFTLPTRQQF
jgi:hypothetical protein